MTRDEKIELFGEGPWVDEVDRLEWRAYGLPCLMRRNDLLGFWCGYVAVPPEHALHGMKYELANRLAQLKVHGGCNYSKPCADEVCHVPEPGEPDDVWWFGFHCGYGFDGIPAYQTQHAPFDIANYRDLNYVRIETEVLASQLAAVTRHRVTVQQ